MRNRLLPLLLGTAIVLTACGQPSGPATPRPDLTVTIHEGAAPTYGPGDAVDLDVVVRNIGTADAGASSLHVHLAGATRPGSSSEAIASQAVSALAAGAEQALTVSIALPEGLSAGAHSLWFKADGEGVLEQANVVNDWVRFAFTVAEGEPVSQDCAENPAAIVTVPDPALRAALVIAVRRDTPSKSEVLSCENLAQVQQLNIRNTGLGSLEGIQYLTAATRLTLANAPFPASERHKIAGMTAVTHLTLEKLPNLTHIDFASSLSELHTLILRETAVTSLSPLQNLRKVEIIWADENRLTTVAPLGGLPVLRLLSATHNDLTAIGALANAPALQSLYLGDNRISNPAGVERITTLTNLDLRGNGISGIGSLEALENLEVLNLARNQLSSIEGLRGLSQLRELVIIANQVGDLDPVSTMTSLTSLAASQNRIANLSPLGGLRGLNQVNLNDNRITDLRPVAVAGLFTGSGRFLHVQFNCVGVGPTLYTINVQPVQRLQEWGVGVGYLPFLESDACDV